MNSYRSLKDIVYDYISDQITRGKLYPNESIREAAICAALETWRDWRRSWPWSIPSVSISM